MMITTHVQDVAIGMPARRVSVELDVFVTGQGWKEIGHGLTSDDGWVEEFHEPAAPGVYRLNYDVGTYSPEAFFPSISVVFEVKDTTETYRVDVLLSPFGYTVHRA